MQYIATFTQLIDYLKQNLVRKTAVVVWASDENTRGAAFDAIEAGFVNVVFVGCRNEINADPRANELSDRFQIIDAPDCDTASVIAVNEIRQGRGDILMKGMLNTDNLLRAVLNKETGILPAGNVLTHITGATIPTYHKLLFFSDVAVIPAPTPEQRAAQIDYITNLTHKLGIKTPRIALIHCSEKVDERHFPFTADYAMLSENSAKGLLGDVIVDGPMDVKVACSYDAMVKKNLISPVNGDADALIFPNIVAGNTFYKTLTLFAGSSVAGIIVGASVPIVLPSRGDSMLSKLYSLALAAL